MTGLYDTDIRLDECWQLTQAADGDAPLCSNLDCLYQNVILEALTQRGDLFYDLDFGWGLYDFIQSEDSELIRLELMQRVRTKLQKQKVILPGSIAVGINRDNDILRVHCAFRFTEEETDRHLNIVIGAVSVEVTEA